MLNPPRHIAGRGMYNIPTGHSLLLFGLSTKCCEDFEESQTTFFISPENSNDYYNKRLLINMSLLFSSASDALVLCHQYRR